MNCPTCGSEIAALDVRFCSQCGRPFGDDSQPSVPDPFKGDLNAGRRPRCLHESQTDFHPASEVWRFADHSGGGRSSRSCCSNAVE